MADDPNAHLTANDEHYAEQSPLAPLDDHLVHQTPDPVRVMWTSDARAYERYWVTTQDRVGDLLMVFGGGFYPNLDTADAYAIVNYKGRHTTVRGHRRLGSDRMDLSVGPIKPTILQGLRTWRYVLEDNPYGISFDIRWHDTKRQSFWYLGPAGGGFQPDGRRQQATSGFEGFGVAEGWVRIGDERIEITPDKYHGTRDRHWGTRDGVGGPRHYLGERKREFGPEGAGGGQWVEFDDWSMWMGRVFYSFGDPRPNEGYVRTVDRKLKFEPDTLLFKEGVITNVLPSGESREFHFRRLGNQIAFLRCGMYDGTPDKNIWKGEYVGELVIDGETYDVNRPEVRAKLIGNDVHHCRMTTSDGQEVSCIFEPHEPGAYEYCRDGRPGWTLWED